MILETKRLYLEELSQRNLPDFFDYASNPNVGNSSLWKPHESMEESKEILDEFIASGEFFGIYHKEDGKLIGVIGLHEDEVRNLDKSICREIGYGLNYNYWNKGYMTEASGLVLSYAFEEMGLKILTGYTSEDNKRSQNVMEKLGLKREGVLRMAWQNYRGETRGKVSYSILKEEL